jgi:hypothetical protein
LYNKRQRWNKLEETVRGIVEESFEKYSNRKFSADALKTFGKDVDFEDIGDRRLFFDWLIHDYEIKDNGYDKSGFTIIQKSWENLQNEHGIDGNKKEKENEIKTLEMWTHSAFRFYEVVDIKKGHGYTVIDIFDNPDPNKHLFLFDHSSSFTINKHDIIYTRLYNVGEILRPASGIINCPRSLLPFIKDYIIHSSQKYYNSKNKTSIKSEKKSIYNNKEKPQLNEYFRKESVSIIKYLDSLNSDDNTSPVLTTAHGDPATLSRSSFLIIKSVRRFLSILDSSEEFVELENEGSTTLRYDWVEKLDVNSSLLGSSTYNPSSTYYSVKKDVDKSNDKNNLSTQQNLGNVHPAEELSLHTILWVSIDEEEDESEKYGKRRSRKNTGRLIPYRVLGNLDITGKTLFIECLSDSLLFRCNNLLESIAGKYLRHMGNTFMEIPSTTSKEPSEQDSNTISRESVNSYQYDHDEEEGDEDDYIDERTQYDIENSFKNMLRQHYDNWITTKNPLLNNKTPLQAARTKEGKESLKELLEVMENNFYRRKDRGVMEDLPSLPFEKIKKKLGLK